LLENEEDLIGDLERNDERTNKIKPKLYGLIKNSL